MPYGYCIRNLTAAAGATAHTMAGGIGGYCTFLIQDRTAAGTSRAVERIYVLQADKLAATVAMNDDTAAACNCDCLLVEPSPMIDVGPIVAGNTRAAGDIYNPNGAYPAYRSLHTGVRFTGTGAATVAVNVTHRLGTASVVSFVSAVSDPYDAVAMEVVRVHQSGVVDANTITLTATCSAGGNITNLAPFDFDVMVLARTAAAGAVIAPQPSGMMPHLSAALAPSDDYTGDTARAVDPGAAGRPSYAALYTNGPAIIAAGTVVTHNLRSATNVSALVGYSAAPGLGYPVITDNATSTTTMTFDRQAAGGADIPATSYIYIFRPHGVFLPTFVTL